MNITRKEHDERHFMFCFVIKNKNKKKKEIQVKPCKNYLEKLLEIENISIFCDQNTFVSHSRYQSQ